MTKDEPKPAASAMTEAACKICLYWLERTGAGPEGECRRFPPFGGYHTYTSGRDWCGEFSPESKQVAEAIEAPPSLRLSN